MQVIKRNGMRVPFDESKIVNALEKCRNAVSPELGSLVIANVKDTALSYLERLQREGKFDEDVHVETIQDAVEHSLMFCGHYPMAQAYIRYRYLHKIRRGLMDTYKDIFFTDAENADFKRDNANINTNASMGMMLKLGTEGAKYFVDNYVLPEEFATADRENWIHIHEESWRSMVTC